MCLTVRLSWWTHGHREETTAEILVLIYCTTRQWMWAMQRSGLRRSWAGSIQGVWAESLSLNCRIGCSWWGTAMGSAHLSPLRQSHTQDAGRVTAGSTTATLRGVRIKPKCNHLKTNRAHWQQFWSVFWHVPKPCILYTIMCSTKWWTVVHPFFWTSFLRMLLSYPIMILSSMTSEPD